MSYHHYDKNTHKYTHKHTLNMSSKCGVKSLVIRFLSWWSSTRWTVTSRVSCLCYRDDSYTPGAETHTLLSQIITTIPGFQKLSVELLQSPRKGDLKSMNIACKNGKKTRQQVLQLFPLMVRRSTEADITGEKTEITAPALFHEHRWKMWV